MTLNRASRNRLNERHISHFNGDTLFDRIARTVCRAGCLPRKELYEAWEVARRVHRRFRGGRVVDLASGHGLLAQILLILDRDIRQAVAVDRHIAASAATLAARFAAEWPGLSDRLSFRECDLEEVALKREDLVVSVHACGGLTDLVLERALAAGCRVAVLPCCHDLGGGMSRFVPQRDLRWPADTGGLEGWLDGPLAMDVTRAARLRAAGYRVYTQTIPGDITPKNRLLMGEPLE